MLDVLIAGAGPAGSIAALVLARAGVRVLIVDRETFPRDKLCGDTVNPGALALLASLGLTGGPLTAAERLKGIILSGPRITVSVPYGGSVAGRTVRRSALDSWLLERAIEAGARFEGGLVARAPLLVDRSSEPIVRGLALTGRGAQRCVLRMPAAMVIAADGGRATLGRRLGLVRTPAEPRRWAFGAYAADVEGVVDYGEMHVRPSAYVGIAPLGDGIVNVCVVTGPRPVGRGPLDVMTRVIDGDARLSQRFRDAVFVGAPRVLGPLAVDASAAGVRGLLLAGDAAGFVDPLTGDGLRLAIQSAMLAAQETLRALETSNFAGAPQRLAEARHAVMGRKLRFDRLVRAMTSSPAAIGVLSCGAAVIPGLMNPFVKYAGDVWGARHSIRLKPDATTVERRSVSG